MKTKLFALFLSLASSVGTLFAESGTCGDDLTWDLTNGELTISGTGAMTSWERSSHVPWDSYRKNITRVTIGNSVTSIGNWAFFYCKGLTNVTIPNSVTYIGRSAFTGCSGLTSVTIPNSVTCIIGGAFKNCSGLTSVTIPNSVTGINPETFAYCYGLRRVTIGNSVKDIGEAAFDGCKLLTSVTIPNGVTSIGESAFARCTGLTSVNIPNSVTNIGKEAFDGCSSLTSVTIPDSVKSIGKYAFAGCKGLTDINVIKDNPNYCSVDGVLFDKGKTILILYPKRKSGVYTIPNSVTNIGNGAFEDCTSLTSVTIPNCVTNIGAGAFYECTRLTSITIPNSVTSIGKYAFSGCSSLTSVTIGNSVTSIGDYAFRDCSSLTTVIWNAKNCGVSCDFGSQVKAFTFGDEVESIPAYCCKGMEKLKSITIPNSVTSIGDYAFSDCSGLTSVTIPDGVKDIRERTFAGCKSLTSITVPNSVTSIGKYAFASCSSLTNIIIPNSVTSIGGYAFTGCHGLTKVTIPNSVTSMGRYAFYACFGLKEVRYPKGLTLSKDEIPSSTKMRAYDRNNPPQQQYNPSQPPMLVLQEGTLVFSDATNNNTINATEQCAVRFKIQNNGKGTAINCEARVKLSGSTSGIKVQNVKLPSIGVGQTYEVSIPITADINTQDGKVTFSIDVYEPNGWGVAPFDLTVATKAYEAPLLQVVDYNVASNSGKIKKMEPFTLTFNLQNTQYGDAEQVKVKINLPANIFVMDGSAELSYAQIKSGEVIPIKITLVANNNYSLSEIPITIDVKERYGKFAENKQLNIALNQTTSSSINIAAKDEPQQERKEIQLAMMTAEVDRNIPKTTTKNTNTFVLIIANENYQSVASVPFALNDGNIFKQYCEQTLGIPAKNIHEVANATGNQLKAQINWLRNVVEVFDNPNVIFYYAGHGIPDEASKTAYLLPVDGSGTDVSTGYKLDDLYVALGNMPASRITVFMDACFSGSKREEGMLTSARGVALKAKSGVPQGNMVVFSAAQGNETAYPNREKQHGLFTYYLLKKLQETAGDVSLQDLGNYIITNVKQQSVLLNSKLQTPCVTPSATLDSNWQNWKLK